MGSSNFWFWFWLLLFITILKPQPAQPIGSPCAADVTNDTLSQLCNGITRLCEDNSEFSTIVRSSCPSQCGDNSMEDDTVVPEYTPRNNETLQMRVDFYLPCAFEERFNFLNGWMFFSEFSGGLNGHPMIRTDDGYVELVPVFEFICPSPGTTEVTCQQVQDKVNKTLTEEKLDLGILVVYTDWCAQAAAEQFEAAEIAFIVLYSDIELLLPRPWNKYRFEMIADPSDFVPLLRHAESVGIRSVGIAYADEFSVISRAISIKRQLQQFALANMSVVYDQSYDFKAAYNSSVWDDILHEMKAHGVEYAIFLLGKEKDHFMKGIADLGIDFKAVSFDKEDLTQLYYLGGLTEFITSTMDYHHTLQYEEDIFGSNAQFVEAFESYSGVKPITADAYSISGLSLITHAVQASNSFDTKKIQHALEETDMKSVLGPVKFSNEHMFYIPASTMQVQDGRLEAVLPVHTASSFIIMPTPAWQCRPLLNQSDPSVCTDYELEVWEYCVDDFPVVRSTFNTTACQTRRDFINSLIAGQDEGNSSRATLLILILFVVVVSCAAFLVGFFLISRYFLHPQSRKTFSAEWLSISDINFILNLNSGEKEVYHWTAFGTCFAGTFRGIQVMINVLQPIPLEGEVERFRSLRTLERFTFEVGVLQRILHPNILIVLGAVFDENRERCLVTERMDPGPLETFLKNRTTRLDNLQILGILCDVAKALLHLHSLTPACTHGDLTSRNIYLNQNLTAKVSGFGLSVHNDHDKPYWLAPEMYEFSDSGEVTVLPDYVPDEALDVYSFGVLMWETFTRQDAFQLDVIDKHPLDVLNGIVSTGLPSSVPMNVRELMRECCHKNPVRRPQMKEVLERLRGVVEQIKYNQKMKIKQFRKNSRLVDQVFPPKVAEALREGKKVEPEHFSMVTIFFSDIVGYTDISSQLEPQQVMNMLDRLYTKFDIACTTCKLFKVETIGDAYMCVGGLPEKQEDQTARVAWFAMEAIAAAASVPVDENQPELGCVNIRIGIHTGSVIASVVGELNPRYCLFGDTVNMASRMESNSEKGQINLSPEANTCLHIQVPGVKTNSRGVLHIKGKGHIECFFLEQSILILQMCASAFVEENKLRVRMASCCSGSSDTSFTPESPEIADTPTFFTPKISTLSNR